MKWVLFLVIVLLSGPIKVVVVSNTIDHSPELIEYLQQEFEVISITAEEFPNYQGYQFYVILGGPDAPEGVGDIVKNVLSSREIEYLRTTEEYNLFIRVKDGKTFFVLAGADRDQTRLAVTDMKDDVLSFIPKSPIKWIDNLDEALQKAQEEDKLVYIDFYTDWCKYCIEMDKDTYPDPRIITLLTEEFVAVKLNREHPQNKDIIKRYNIYVQPTEVVLAPDGELIWGHRGYLDADELYFYLTSILSQNPSIHIQ
jgi:thioredoxin 1